MMKNKKILLGLATAALLISGCGSSSGSSSSETTTPPPAQGVTQTGIFVDAPVEGLRYKTATREGFTNDEGKYEYEAGEEVEFFLGNLSFGKVLATDIVTPYTLAGDTNIDAPSILATNIAQLLQSLDDTSDTGHIVIPQSLNDLDISNIDLSLNIDADLQEILTEASYITQKTYVLVGEDEANANLKTGVEAVQVDENTEVTWSDVSFLGSFEFETRTEVYPQSHLNYSFVQKTFVDNITTQNKSVFIKQTQEEESEEENFGLKYHLLDGAWLQNEGRYEIEANGTILSIKDEAVQLQLVSNINLSGTTHTLDTFEGMKVTYPEGSIEYKVKDKNPQELYTLENAILPSFYGSETADSIVSGLEVAATNSFSLNLQDYFSLTTDGLVVDTSEKVMGSIVTEVGTWTSIILPNQTIQSVKILITNPQYQSHEDISKGVDFYILSKDSKTLEYESYIYFGKHSYKEHKYEDQLLLNPIAMDAVKDAVKNHDYASSPGYKTGFSDSWFEDRTLYQVVQDTYDRDNDADYTEYILLAQTFKNGVLSLDYNADGTLEVNDETYSVIEKTDPYDQSIYGVLNMKNYEGTLLSYRPAHILNIFLDAGNADDYIVFYYKKEDAQKNLLQRQSSN